MKLKLMSYKTSVHIHTERAEHFTPINQLLCTTINLFSVFKLYADDIFMDYNTYIDKKFDNIVCSNKPYDCCVLIHSPSRKYGGQKN